MESKTKRLGRLIKAIGNRPGITLTGLCKFFQHNGGSVSERTIANDILTLKMEYGLLPTPGRQRSGYQLLDMVTLGNTEIGIITDALCAFAVNLDDPEAQKVSSRLLKCIDRVHHNDIAGRECKRFIGQRVIVERRQDTRHLESLIMSVVRQHLPVKLKYRSPRTKGFLHVIGYPLFKIFYERAWYLIIREYKTRSYYPCRLDRIVEAATSSAPTNSTFLEDIAEAKYLMSCGWGMTFPASQWDLKVTKNTPDIVVRFDNSVAPYILEAKRRHPFASIRKAADGSGDAIFSIKLYDAWEFRHWVRSFGAAARFIAPARLVDEERTEVSRLVHKYGLNVSE